MKRKKLRLDRDTIRRLSNNQLGEVAGGATIRACSPTMPDFQCTGGCTAAAASAGNACTKTCSAPCC